jgi:hypothetical protein
MAAWPAWANDVDEDAGSEVASAVRPWALDAVAVLLATVARGCECNVGETQRGAGAAKDAAADEGGRAERLYIVNGRDEGETSNRASDTTHTGGGESGGQ